jgi:hypothetical protein
MKTCCKCKEVKQLDQFHNLASAVDGKQKTCKTCQKAYSQSAACVANRKEYYKRTKRAHIDRNLQNQYGISHEDYDLMLEKQNGQCAICGTTQPEGKGRFHVDHCHTTGRVRGLLCHHCNTMLGLAKDSAQTLNKAIHYLTNV